MAYYAIDLIPESERPPDYPKSLTTYGLFTLRRPEHWRPILASREASLNAFHHLARFDGPDDGSLDRLRLIAIQAVAAS